MYVLRPAFATNREHHSLQPRSDSQRKESQSCCKSSQRAEAELCEAALLLSLLLSLAMDSRRSQKKAVGWLKVALQMPPNSINNHNE
jgi:hypothetical protein